MSQDLTTRKFTRRSLSEPRSARTVLLRMAEDQERADRLRALKDEYPSVTWRQLAEHVGVAERSVLNWAAGKGMDYDHAVKAAEFFRGLGADIPDDYVWRGHRADTPDPFSAVEGASARLAALEGMVKQLLQDRETLQAEIAEQNSLLARQTVLLERIEELVRVLEGAEVTEQAAEPGPGVPELPSPGELDPPAPPLPERTSGGRDRRLSDRRRESA
jgi:hypothetical protein